MNEKLTRMKRPPITKQEVDAIRNEYMTGVSWGYLMTKYNVSRNSLQRILAGSLVGKVA